MSRFTAWGPDESASHISVPGERDDKYSRGVLGVVTGSKQYPGAAILGVEAALRTGVGMVRYLGPERPSTMVLQRRPETVTSLGRVQAWLLGSGMDAQTRDPETAGRLTHALSQGLPTVLDAGALDLLDSATGPVVITPHAGELARVLGITREQVAANPERVAMGAAEKLGVTVLLKGHRSLVAAPDGTRLVASSAPSWLATAGAGDALAGILGSLVATHSAAVTATGPELARLTATACVIHGLAAQRAGNGGPFVVLELAEQVSAVIAELVA